MAENEENYTWSDDPETYHEEVFISREFAIKDALRETKAGAVFTIARCETPDPLNYIDSQDLIDRILEQNEFCVEWNDDWPNCAEEVMKDLDKRLMEAFKGWMDTWDTHPRFCNCFPVAEYLHEKDEAGNSTAVLVKEYEQ